MDTPIALTATQYGQTYTGFTLVHDFTGRSVIGRLKTKDVGSVTGLAV